MRAARRSAPLVPFIGALFFAPIYLSYTASAQLAPQVQSALPDSEINKLAAFAEPLIRTKLTETTEDRALVRALDAYSRRATPDDVGALISFLAAYPRTGWASAIYTNIGLSYLHYGYYTRAIDAFSKAWVAGKTATSPEAKALTDQAIGKLATLYASFGLSDRLAELFEEIGSRPIAGSATEDIQLARELLNRVKTNPRKLFNCGPVALMFLAETQGIPAKKASMLQWYDSGPDGTSLAELGRLSGSVQLDTKVVRRRAGQAIPMPAVAHFKLGHFAIVLGEENGRLHIKDPTFAQSDRWITKAAFEEETSGYFLIPSSMPTDAAFASVSNSEALAIRGKGPSDGDRPGGAGDGGAGGAGGNGGGAGGGAGGPGGAGGGGGGGGGAGGGGGGGGGGRGGGGGGAGGGDGGGDGGGGDGDGDGDRPPQKSCPLCVYDIKMSAVSVSISDTPVGYRPAFGPSTKVRISYNQREDSQPANFSFFNVSQKWTLDWLSYVTDDPTNVGASVSRFLSGGGAFFYSGYNSASKSFTAQDVDGAVLSVTSTNPISYRLQRRDGTVEIYAQPDNSTSYPRNVFLSKVIDPQGNAVTLNYDLQRRLTSLTDAVGRQTTFSYEASGRPLLVTKITDPFGRSASITYDPLGRLSSITDVIGLKSSVTYDANSLVNSLTTPYGTTQFSYTAPGTSGPPRFVDITDPMGFHERVEWLEPAPIPDSDPPSTVPVGMPVAPLNQYLTYRNSFYWDKNAYVEAGCTISGGCDYSKALVAHYVHFAGSKKGTAFESIKQPLENRVWYAYPGQLNSYSTGSFAQPIAKGRVLDDGSTQIYRYTYDPLSYNRTSVTDPSGRTTQYVYAANGIDLISVSQTTQNGIATPIRQYTYNGQHRPIVFTDAAGQTTLYRYNAAGQLLSSTNPLNETTSNTYSPTGDLLTVKNANNAIAQTYTYDSYARVRTFTDSEGWMITYDYDDADRITRITYSDGTSKSYAYDKLNLSSYRDREYRTWKYGYDANGRITSITDPAGKQTFLGYNNIGSLTSLTDPNGNLTNWTYDIQGRLTSKIYANGSIINYVYESTNSRLKSETDALGQTKLYSYFIDGLLSGVSYTNTINPTAAVSYSYDPFFKRVSNMSDGVGSTHFDYAASFTPGALQLQQECFTPTGGTSCSSQINYSYDALSRQSSRNVSESAPESYQYDAIGRMTERTNDLGTFTLQYLGQTNQITLRQLLSSPLKTTWSYLDNIGDRRLASISNDGLASGQYSNFQFDTSPENFIKSISEATDGVSAYPNASTQTSTYNDLNQLIELSGQALSYDANGNLLSDGNKNYSWDAENRLISISYPTTPGKQTSFTYDGLSRRISITDTPSGGGSSTTIKYIWCGRVICQAQDSTGNRIKSYYSEGEWTAGSPAQLRYYGIDQLGSVRRIFSSVTSSKIDYDPYGITLQATSQPSGFTYAGTLHHESSGLLLTQFRIYDPTIGRWLSRDPVGELNYSNRAQANPVVQYGLGAQSDIVARGDTVWDWSLSNGVKTVRSGSNLYHYADSNPLNLLDPTGEAGVSGFEDMIAQDFISAYCKGSIMSEFPGEYLSCTIGEIQADASCGLAPARKAMKLLMQDRFRK